MELAGSYFTYSGTSSRKYNLIFAHVKTDEMTKMVGNVQGNRVYNKGGNRNYFIGESFEDSPIQFEAEIVNDKGGLIPVHQRREIEKWLFHQTDYRKLYIDWLCDDFAETVELIDGQHVQMYLNCRLTNPERLNYGGGVSGYKFTVECDSCMAWQDAVTFEYVNENSNSDNVNIYSVNVDTDLHDFVYPKVKIKTGNYGGDITIVNNADDSSRLTKFIGITAGTEFTMTGGGSNFISGDNFLKFSDKNFVRLVDGENKITVMGDVRSITFTFQNRRYI